LTTAKREARERALELLYESEAKGVHPCEVIADLPVPPHAYAAQLAEGVGDHRELLDHVVGARARGWTVARMPAVDRALLRLATFELTFETDLPTGVAIDEAVELARGFSTDASPSFVNGVLAAVVKDVRDGGPWSGAHRPAVLVLDCDGVVRHWDVDATHAAEEALGLPAGTVGAVALEPELLQRASTGDLTAEAWAEEIGRLVAEDHGVEAAAVAGLWTDAPWSIDDAVIELVRRAKATGVPTACFSNATTNLEDDLAGAGVADAFDTIVNSSRLGLAKPEAAFYTAACEAAGVRPDQVLFVDDRAENVVGALDAGVGAVRFQGPERLRAVLARTGLLRA
jgi:transcription antitermination factor NusB